MFKYSCLHFPGTTFPASPTSHPQSFGFVPGPLYMFIYDPFLSYPRYFRLPSPLVPVTLLFHIS